MDVLNRYRDNNSSDDDSEDSDKECTVWKRATAVKRMAEEENLQNVQCKEVSDKTTSLKRKKNTIWTEVLEDQLIAEDLEDCLLRNKPAHYESRGKESYDYTLKYKDPRNLKDTDCSMDEENFIKKRNSLPRHNKPGVKKFVKLDSAEQSAARKITRILNEKKVYLIQRVVKILGIEKSLTLLSMTEQIEETGGMMVNNNARRRTPGGVYLQLLKSDKDVTQEMLDKIFEGEMNCVELKKYYAEKKKKRKIFKGRKGCTESKKPQLHDMTMDTEETSCMSSSQIASVENKNPIPLTVITKNSSNSSDLEEGEIAD